jgi:MoaA/NifB/PqqE/SkfB family radical SAM enzyme
MKLVAVFSASHEKLKDEWFLGTLKDDYDVALYRCDVRGQGAYMQEDWTRAVLFKSATIIKAIQDNWGEVFVYSDVDVAFFGPTKLAVLKSLAGKDIVCQLDDPSGNLCTGFFGIRANDTTLSLWRQVQAAVERERRDQPAFNRLVRDMKDLRAGYLPVSFFGPGTFSARLVDGERFYIPADPVMFHANFTLGVDNKMKLLTRAHRIIRRGEWARRVNSVFFHIQMRNKTSHIDALTRQNGIMPLSTSHRQVFDHDAYARPRSVALDLSTACQLKCPSCPTATGAIARSIGAGFVTLTDFKKFLHDNPRVSDIELSNWGEVFLNPDLEQILRHAYRRHVTLRIDNGANLDRASERQLEALVKYKLRSLSCSIDGASQDVYSVYRVKGHFDRVISHIRQIVAFKKKYRSPYPILRWQFVAFGHNEHEIGKARDMARELGMEFFVKLSWDDLYTKVFSPVKDRKLIEQESGLGVADRREYEARFGRGYIAATCHQLWLRPRINFDGRLLGCSINHWGDFGNVFVDGLESSLNGAKMRRTKDMLMGLGEADAASPCLRCQVYESMRRNHSWVRPEALVPPGVESLLRRWMTNSILYRPLTALFGLSDKMRDIWGAFGT